MQSEPSKFSVVSSQPIQKKVLQRTGKVFKKRTGVRVFKPKYNPEACVILGNKVYELRDIEDSPIPFRKTDVTSDALVFLKDSILELRDDDRPESPKFLAQSGMDKQETMPVVVEQTQLTTTVLSDEKQQDKNNVPYLHFNRNVDPMPDQGLGKVLSRKYRIGTFTWSGASAKNAQLFTAVFPKALLDVAPNLIEKINRFHFFRANVLLEFHVAGTMYHYGSLMAAIQPFCKGEDANPRMESIWRMSTMDHVLISPDSNTTTQITIPFMGQQTHWPHDLTNAEGYFGALQIRVLFPLKVQNATTTPTLPVTIFAQFVNPEVMGPTLHAQSATDLDAMAVQTDREQVAKSSSGIVSKSLEFASRLASACVLIPGAGTIAGVAASGLFFGSKVARYFGFDKPENISKFQPVYLTTANAMANGNGMNTVNSLTMDVENKISNNSEDFQAKTCETDISHLCSLPGLFLDGVFDTSSTAGTVIAKWHNSPCVAPATSTLIQYIPCSAIASHFLYWRGDMKYVLFIRCSKFHVCKIRISFHPTFDEIVLSPEGEGDFPSMVYDINGDTTIEFKVPYMHNEPYCMRHMPNNPTWDEGTYAGAIAISIVNPVASVPGTIDTSIYYAVYAAADQYMDYQGPYESTMLETGLLELIAENYTTFGPPFVAQSGKENSCVPHEIFKRDFPYLYPAQSTRLQRVCFGEEMRSILDLLHRFQKVDGLTCVTDTFYNIRYPTKYFDATVGLLPYNHCFEFFREWFCFARGGLTWKITPNRDLDTGANLAGSLYAQNIFDLTMFQVQDPNYKRNGAVFENFHYKPTLEVSIGHYSKYPYWWREKDYPTEFRGNVPGTYNGLRLQYLGLEHDAARLLVFLAARDDTSFGYPRGCPLVYHYNPNPGDEFVMMNDNDSVNKVVKPMKSLRAKA